MSLNTMAQGQGQGQGQGQRGNRPPFDPAQMQERMLERTKETLEITSDEDWKAISPLVQKVFQARMATMGGGFGRGGMGRGPGGPGGPGGDQQGQGGQQRRFGPAPSAESEALQKAIDAKAPKAELMAAVAKVKESRKVKQAELEQAQDALRKVLTARQEALATRDGLL